MGIHQENEERQYTHPIIQSSKMYGRYHHTMAFQTPTDGTDIYKGSFFPQNIRDRNNLPESVNISSEIADECVAKFTSLVRARTQYILGPR